MLKENCEADLRIKLNNKLLIFIVTLALFPAFAALSRAEEGEKNAPPPEINVTADRLVSDRNARYAEFSGRVVVTREASRLTCDNLKIYYMENKKDAGGGSENGSVEKMIASGSVRLIFEDKEAVAERAVYTAASDSVVLTGGEPKVTTGKSFVSGEKITLYRTDGRVLVDSGASTRVKAEFHPADKNIADGMKKPHEDLPENKEIQGPEKVEKR